MKLPQLVAITGVAGSGKSTLADILVRDFQFTRMRFADPLKRMLMIIGLTVQEVDGEFKEVPNPILLGKTPRHAMQTLGIEWGRRYIGEAFWTELWKGLTKLELDRGRRVVVDDCRFLNEAVTVRALGGQIWRLIRPGTEARFNYSSELELNRISFDLRFSNDAGIEDLRRLVKKVLHGNSP